MNITEPVFEFDALIKITGANPGMVQNWLARGLFRWSKNGRGGGNGKRRRFSVLDAVMFSVFLELRNYVSVGRAGDYVESAANQLGCLRNACEFEEYPYLVTHDGKSEFVADLSEVSPSSVMGVVKFDSLAAYVSTRCFQHLQAAA